MILPPATGTLPSLRNAALTQETLLSLRNPALTQERCSHSGDPALTQESLPQPRHSTATMMEEDIELWQQVFQELIQEVKPWHKWTLTQDKGLLPDVLKPGWMQYQQKTFARFHCSWCSRSWASGCVLTIFHMHWCEKKGQGQVKMRVFAQRCNKCPEPPFAAPEFTWDNISRILNNLLFRILKRCYGEGFKQVDEIPLLGDTSLEGPHDSNNCEACLQGFCAQSGLGLASKPPERPLSPTPSKSTREPKVTAIHSSNVPRSQTSSKVEKPQASKVDPKTSNPTKAALKVSHTSHPSTTILTVQQVSAVSSPTPGCITQMPSPIKSSKAADAGKKTRSKIPKALPPSSSFVPPTPSSFAPPTSSSFAPPTPSSFAPPTPSYVVPNSWRPPANTARQVERSVHIPPPSESCCESCCGACCQCGTACCEGFCNCMAHKPCQSLVFLFFVAIIVTLYIKYGL